MDGMTIYIRRINNGFTITRQLELEQGYSSGGVTFCADMKGILAEAATLIESAEHDAATTAPDSIDAPF